MNVLNLYKDCLAFSWLSFENYFFQVSLPKNILVKIVFKLNEKKI